MMTKTNNKTINRLIFIEFLLFAAALLVLSSCLIYNHSRYMVLVIYNTAIDTPKQYTIVVTKKAALECYQRAGWGYIRLPPSFAGYYEKKTRVLTEQELQQLLNIAQILEDSKYSETMTYTLGGTSYFLLYHNRILAIDSNPQGGGGGAAMFGILIDTLLELSPMQIDVSR